MERPGADRHRAVHGHSRRCDCQRRLAVDQVRSRLLAGEPAVGDLGVCHLLRRGAAARRPARRPAGTEASLHRGPGSVRSELAALRPCLVRSVVDRVPRASGPRRSAARPGRARAADDDIRRRAGPQPCTRDLRCRRGQRRCRGRVARRSADVVSELALDLLHQRPGRRRRDRAHSCAAAGKPRRARASPLRLRRRGDHHRRADAARLRAHTCDDRRLGHRHDDRPPRGRGRPRARLRRDRAALEGTAPADADLQVAEPSQPPT